MWPTAAALIHSPEVEGKVLLLKTSCSSDAGPRDLKAGTDLNASSLWSGFPGTRKCHAKPPMNQWLLASLLHSAFARLPAIHTNLTHFLPSIECLRVKPI